jgi:hypothetical protein
MILASVAALILGLGIGYLLGLRDQASDEVIADRRRECDEDILHSVRWEVRETSFDLDFIRGARMTDPTQETVHNVPLSMVLDPIGPVSERLRRNAERAIIGAVKIDRKNGRVVSAILPETRRSKRIVPLLRKAGIRTTIGPDIPR